MKRTNRDLNVFNMSMLDVIASALGAFLILFLITSQTSADYQQRVQTKDDQMDTLSKQVRKGNDAIQALKGALDKCREDLKACEDRPQPPTPPTGEAIGNCHVGVAKVNVFVKDSGSEDGDRVKLKWNDEVIRAELTLSNAGQHLNLSLKPGPNYLHVTALNEGSSSPNTAVVVVDPCHEDGRAEAFDWQMLTGQEKFVSIVRK